MYSSEQDKILAERLLCEHSGIQVIARIASYWGGPAKLQLCQRHGESGGWLKGVPKRMSKAAALMFADNLTKFINDYKEVLEDEKTD